MSFLNHTIAPKHTNDTSTQLRRIPAPAQQPPRSEMIRADLIKDIVAAPSSYHEFTGPEPLAYDGPGTDKGNEW
jgi:hypothetical protein